MKKKVTKKVTTKVTAEKVTAVAPPEKLDIEDLKFHSSGRLNEETMDKIQKLEKILGTGRINSFGTSDLRVFRQNASVMTMGDLKNLCVKVGLFPSGNKPQLIVRLEQEFLRQTKGTRTVALQVDNPVLDPSTEEHKKAIKVLNGLR